MRKQGIARLLGVGLLLGAASCVEGTGEPSTSDPARAPTSGPGVPARGALASLVQVSSCDDLLTRVQNDAIAKLQMSVAQAKQRAADRKHDASRGRIEDEAVDFAAAPWPATRPSAGRNGGSATSDDRASAIDESAAAPRPPVDWPAPERAGGDDDSVGEASDASGAAEGPVGASETNKQVRDVDEADFVKVVESGQGIFLLHGNTLRKLKSWPAAETQLVGTPLTIEGAPSEMFVTAEGKAVVFSSVAYGSGAAYRGASGARPVIAEACWEGGCDGYDGYYGGNGLKVTIADVAGAVPKVERELYYEGSYVSSRRYDLQEGDVVRAIVQANTRFSGLFEPDIEWHDPWGRVYDDANIARQLAEWEQRTTVAIRRTTLAEWIPEASEKKNGELVPIAPACGSYFVPPAGLSDYGLTHVLSLDVAHPEQPVGGVTILGASSTVYSSAQQLILAQPDYRWTDGFDFGIESAQQTALHVFDLAAGATAYRASGFVPGHLPLRNPQFGIDVKEGTIRLATTGLVRDEASGESSGESEESWFGGAHTENYVITARVDGNGLAIVGKSPKLGHEGESVYSARFVGDRAYVVTFRETDPFIVVDVANPALPTVLGEVEIPGFSEYMHPLDANHVITVGQSETRGIKLQLFDVTDPMHIPQPKTLDFGSGSSSEVSYQHKAFTFFEGVLAIPLSGVNHRDGYGGYVSALRLVRVDPVAGFTDLGGVDHAPLYADNGAGVGCGVCDALSCSHYSCRYRPEVRRGVFVKGEATTYVYSFSHAGVLVNDLANLAQPVARVGLPAPQYGYGPEGGRTPPSGGFAEVDPADVEDPAFGDDEPPAVPAQDASVAPQDAGVPVQDASVSVLDGGVPLPDAAVVVTGPEPMLPVP